MTERFYNQLNIRQKMLDLVQYMGTHVIDKPVYPTDTTSAVQSAHIEYFEDEPPEVEGIAV